MGGSNSKRKLEELIFDMRLNSKQLIKLSQKAQQEEKAEQLKAKKAMEKGLMDNARIHAENSIRKKSESLNYMRLSAKMDAVASRIATASRTEDMTVNFKKATVRLGRVMKNMNPEQISKTMEEFEKTFEDLDVASGYMTDSLNSAVATSTPATQVDSLLAQIAEEHNIAVSEELSLPGRVGAERSNASVDLKSRFENLR
jgi:charged multivesicular body protein 1